MGFFSDIQGLAFREKYILTFHCDPSMTIGTASLWKIDGFQVCFIWISLKTALTVLMVVNSVYFNDTTNLGEMVLMLILLICVDKSHLVLKLHIWRDTLAVFLVMLGTSSFPARHEVYWKSTEKFVLSWERARTQHD